MVRLQDGRRSANNSYNTDKNNERRVSLTKKKPKMEEKTKDGRRNQRWKKKPKTKIDAATYTMESVLDEFREASEFGKVTLPLNLTQTKHLPSPLTQVIIRHIVTWMRLQG